MLLTSYTTFRPKFNYKKVVLYLIKLLNSRALLNIYLKMTLLCYFFPFFDWNTSFSGVNVKGRGMKIMLGNNSFCYNTFGGVSICLN